MITGKWSGTTKSPLEVFNFVFDFEQQGELLTGTVTHKEKTTPISNGKVDGDTVYFEMTVQSVMGPGLFKCTLKINGDEYTGTAIVPMSKVSLKGKKLD